MCSPVDDTIPVKCLLKSNHISHLFENGHFNHIIDPFSFVHRRRRVIILSWGGIVEMVILQENAHA